MAKVLDDAVTQEKDGTWTFQCPGILNSLCGDHGVPFRSTLWPTKKTAAARGAEHFSDHKLGAEIIEARAALPEDATFEQHNKVRNDVIKSSEHKVQSELADFLAEHGLAPHPDGSGRCIRIEDLP